MSVHIYQLSCRLVSCYFPLILLRQSLHFQIFSFKDLNRFVAALFFYVAMWYLYMFLCVCVYS